MSRALPRDCLGEIITFLSDDLVVLRLLRLSKAVHEFITVTRPSCLEHVTFFLRSPTARQESQFSLARFVRRLSIDPELHPNLRCAVRLRPDPNKFRKKGQPVHWLNSHSFFRDILCFPNVTHLTIARSRACGLTGRVLEHFPSLSHLRLRLSDTFSDYDIGNRIPPNQLVGIAIDERGQREANSGEKPKWRLLRKRAKAEFYGRGEYVPPLSVARTAFRDEGEVKCHLWDDFLTHHASSLREFTLAGVQFQSHCPGYFPQDRFHQRKWEQIRSLSKFVFKSAGLDFGFGNWFDLIKTLMTNCGQTLRHFQIEGLRNFDVKELHLLQAVERLMLINLGGRFYRRRSDGSPGLPSDIRQVFLCLPQSRWQRQFQRVKVGELVRACLVCSDPCIHFQCSSGNCQKCYCAQCAESHMSVCPFDCTNGSPGSFETKTHLVCRECLFWSCESCDLRMCRDMFDKIAFEGSTHECSVTLTHLLEDSEGGEPSFSERLDVTVSGLVEKLYSISTS